MGLWEPDMKGHRSRLGPESHHGEYKGKAAHPRRQVAGIVPDRGKALSTGMG